MCCNEWVSLCSYGYHRRHWVKSVLMFVFDDEVFVGMVVSVFLSGMSFSQSWMAAACVHVGEDQGAGMVCGARGCCNGERFIRRQRL